MDTTYTMAPTSVQGQPSFAYYPTDPTAQRQHTHYPSHPSEMQPFYGQMQAFPHHPQHHHHHQQQPHQQQPQQPQPQQQQQPQHGLPDHHQQQPLYASQPMMNMHQMATTNAFRGAMNMTPIASPQPSQLKPTIIVQPGAPALMPLDTRFVSTDYYGFPSTPPLSTSGSSISSPPSSSGAQHTPISDSFLSFEKVEGVKEGCENEVHAEILANPQWGRSESPPMTPVFIQQPSFTASQASDLLSANGSCPSLSPSPSPVSSNFDPQAHHALVSQPQSSLPVEPASSHFCDPRELTVESTVNAAASDLPPLPTLSCEEEHKSVLDGAAAAVTLPVHENPSPTFTHSSTEDALTALPTFDSFSDLDSEDEFVNRLVDFHPSGNAFFLGDKRQRVGAYGIDEDSFLSEHGLEDEDAVAQTSYSLEGATDLAHGHDHGERAEEMVSKRQRTNSRKPIKRSSTASESDDEKTVQASVNTRASNSQPTNGGHHSHAEARQVSEVSTASPADSATPPVSVNRRGRKQSLTDDPSKTFVCTLCSRRFRRQEHLKRHYRSLHTQDKPFECNECGKKFSRSDNLAQHARTHGGQSVVMGIMESSEAAHAAAYDDHDPNALGAVLYEAANAAAAKSTSSEPSEAGPSDTPAVDRRSANKKRKRDENAA